MGLPVPLERVRSKGWSGVVIERELGASDGGHGVDFAALGLELKTVPTDRALRPLESTWVCHVDPTVVAGESWASSYARRKLARVLFVALEVPGDGRGVAERRVAAVRLWSPSAAEEDALRADFELFARDHFRRGRAHEITGRLGAVMQVRPKGRDAADTRPAYGPDGRPVRVGRMGFYLRPAFVGRILRAVPAGAERDILPGLVPPAP
jgi:DNA mismatch repair protein MutH